MNFFLNFFQKYRYTILFLLLQLISIVSVINKNVYHNLIINRSIISFNAWYGNSIKNISNYFNLREDNDVLQEENNRLKELLYGIKKIDTIEIYKMNDSLKNLQSYEFISAISSNNTIIYKDNYFYINRGYKNSIKNDMGIITSKGIAGQVVEVGENYSKAMSILNSYIRINARVKTRNYSGTLSWNAEDSRLMHLYEVPKYAELQIGDTIETASSKIFPEGILIGRIAGLNIENRTGNWDIEVELFQEMAKLSKVNIVKKITEIKPIINPIKDSINNVK